MTEAQAWRVYAECIDRGELEPVMRGIIPFDLNIAMNNRIRSYGGEIGRKVYDRSKPEDHKAAILAALWLALDAEHGYPASVAPPQENAGT